MLMLCSLASCSYYYSEHQVVSRLIEVDVSNGEIIEHIDTHGGIHGDGETYAEIIFTDDSFESKIKDHDGWRELPLSENVQRIIYGSNKNRLFIDDNLNRKIPLIENGYYYFYDNQNEEGNKYDDSLFSSRPSFNYRVAIYNVDSKTLYYYQLDT